MIEAKYPSDFVLFQLKSPTLWYKTCFEKVDHESMLRESKPFEALPNCLPYVLSNQRGQRYAYLISVSAGDNVTHTSPTENVSDFCKPQPWPRPGFRSSTRVWCVLFGHANQTRIALFDMLGSDKVSIPPADAGKKPTSGVMDQPLSPTCLPHHGPGIGSRLRTQMKQ
jgi:hypothetical protein